MVVGECIPVSTLDVLVRMLAGIREFYLNSEGTAAAAFHGKIKEDGTIELPMYMREAFKDKEVFVAAISESKMPEHLAKKLQAQKPEE